jgi:hypothetical protein
VTAVVLTYDGRQLLDVVMPSLLAQDYSDFDVIVVDNGSRDGTPEHVRERWPGAGLLVLDRNVGVAAALNRGVSAVRSEYVALLNNDLELEPTWLGCLVSCLDGHPGAGSATGKLLNFGQRSVFDAAGDLMRWSGAATHRGYREPDRGQFDRGEAIFGPCAGAALYRRSALEEVGPFDEDFFAYQEDVDWSLRAQLLGWPSRYEPGAVAYHMGGATTGGARGRYNVLQRRNQLLVLIKCYPAGALWRHAPKILYGQAGALAEGLSDGTWRVQLRAWRQVLRMLPATLRKRGRIQASRRATLSDLEAVMSAERYAGRSITSHVAEIATLLGGRPGRWGRS